MARDIITKFASIPNDCHNNVLSTSRESYKLLSTPKMVGCNRATAVVNTSTTWTATLQGKPPTWLRSERTLKTAFGLGSCKLCNCINLRLSCLHCCEQAQFELCSTTASAILEHMLPPVSCHQPSDFTVSEFHWTPCRICCYQVFLLSDRRLLFLLHWLGALLLGHHHAVSLISGRPTTCYAKLNERECRKRSL